MKQILLKKNPYVNVIVNNENRIREGEKIWIIPS